MGHDDPGLRRTGFRGLSQESHATLGLIALTHRLTERPPFAGGLFVGTILIGDDVPARVSVTDLAITSLAGTGTISENDNLIFPIGTTFQTAVQPGQNTSFGGSAYPNLVNVRACHLCTFEQPPVPLRIWTKRRPIVGKLRQLLLTECRAFETI